MALKTIPVKRGLDLDLLMKMQGPITVHVSRARGALREPISLPVKEGYGSGAGWEKDEVKEIEQYIVQVPEAVGGGVFEVQIVDSSVPEPLSMKYDIVLAAEMYANMANRNVFPGVPYAGPQPLGTNGWGVPPGSASYGVPPMGPPPSMGYGAYGAPPPNPGFRSPIPSFAGPQAGGQTETERLRDQLHRQEIQNVANQYQAQYAELQRQAQAAAAAAAGNPQFAAALEREREERLRAEREAVEARRAAEAAVIEARHRAEMDALKASMASIADAVKASQNAPRNDDTVSALKAELAQMRADAVNAAARAEDARRTDAMMAQIAALSAKINERPQGPDPTTIMLTELLKAQTVIAEKRADADKETARLKADTDKEIARANAGATKDQYESMMKLVEMTRIAATQNAVAPVEMMKMLKEAGNGADDFTKTMIRSMTDFMGLQKDATLNLLNMQPQGEGVMGRVVDGMREAVDTFAKTSAQTEAAKANAQAQIVRAQADIAQANAAAMQAQWAPPPQAGAGLGNSQASQVIVPPSAGPQAPALPAQASQAPTAPTIEVPQALIHGKTEEAWLGPALPDVLKLREGVAAYLEAVGGDQAALHQPNMEPITVIDPSTKKSIGVSPYTAAGFLILAAGEIEKKRAQGLIVPAFDVFYSQQMYTALMEVVLPQAPSEYRVDVIRFLDRRLRGVPSGGEHDEPMYGIAAFLNDEGDEEPEAEAASGNGASAIAAPPTKILNRPTRAARA